MPNDDIITDEYVTERLASEAHDSSIKYSTMGLEAYRQAKPTNKAKPNTRFLRNIIKETTNHNAALLARETAESQARLSNLAAVEEKRQQRYKPDAGDIRRRQLGDISAILSGKRKRDAGGGLDQKAGSKERSHPRSEHKRHRGREGRTPSDDEPEEADRRAAHRHRHRHREDKHQKGGEERSRSRSRSPTRRDRTHRQRSPLNGKGDERHTSRSKRTARGDTHERDDLFRSRLSPRKRDGRLMREEDSDHSTPQSRGSRRTRHDRLAGGGGGGGDAGDQSEQDISEDDIGPAPPPRSALRTRGRGAASGSSAMDDRFAQDYDPKSDVAPDVVLDSGSGDWEEALEAFRDRQKWKSQGADRLRAAGFTDEQVKKWEAGGERTIEDVRWSQKGEKREWDRGKDVGQDGLAGAGNK